MIPNRTQRYQKILEYGKEFARICACLGVTFPLIAEKMERWMH
jgi:hypothetical protein